MKFETKFDIGQKVWKNVFESVSREEFECPVCKGTGSSILAPSLPCDARLGFVYHCNKGKMGKSVMIYSPQQFTIQAIHCNYDIDESDRYSVDYELSDHIGYFGENEIFATQEEAQKECNRLNAKDK